MASHHATNGVAFSARVLRVYWCGMRRRPVEGTEPDTGKQLGRNLDAVECINTIDSSTPSTPSMPSAPPSLAAISPNLGSTGGATPAQITGIGFQPGATVTNGGAMVPGRRDARDPAGTVIYLDVPAHAAGAVDGSPRDSSHGSAHGCVAPFANVLRVYSCGLETDDLSKGDAPCQHAFAMPGTIRRCVVCWG